MLGATAAVCGFGCPLGDPDHVDLVMSDFCSDAPLCLPGGVSALG